ncbi:hypothetical protein [Pseudanabaena sp. PCC 6802]|uniref:hypothetical protein n=1 Tax=Pseudanabaena sp. PCC 6802 TaxID=118173 RepID=UPI00034883C5|nr:hypothetical protein [Pseudanabaena sp. PCC 6802]
MARETVDSFDTQAGEEKFACHDRKKTILYILDMKGLEAVMVGAIAPRTENVETIAADRLVIAGGVRAVPPRRGGTPAPRPIAYWL